MNIFYDTIIGLKTVTVPLKKHFNKWFKVLKSSFHLFAKVKKKEWIIIKDYFKLFKKLKSRRLAYFQIFKLDSASNSTMHGNKIVF